MSRMIIEMEVLGLDTKALEQEIKEKIESGMDELLEEIEWTWRMKASSELNTSKQAYLDGLNFEKNGTDIDINISGGLAVAIESGSEKFNLKPGFLKNGKMGGLYNTIPIMINGVQQYRTVRPGQQKTPWDHPGIQARSFGDKVKVEMDDMVDKVFSKLFNRVNI